MTNPENPAFPVGTITAIGEPVDLQSGLTKREYFAAMAMNGISVWDAQVNEPIHAGKIEELAKACVSYADALIAELNKETKP